MVFLNSNVNYTQSCCSYTDLQALHCHIPDLLERLLTMSKFDVQPLMSWLRSKYGDTFDPLENQVFAQQVKQKSVHSNLFQKYKNKLFTRNLSAPKIVRWGSASNSTGWAYYTFWKCLEKCEKFGCSVTSVSLHLECVWLCFDFTSKFWFLSNLNKNGLQVFKQGAVWKQQLHQLWKLSHCLEWGHRMSLLAWVIGLYSSVVWITLEQKRYVPWLEVISHCFWVLCHLESVSFTYVSAIFWRSCFSIFGSTCTPIELSVNHSPSVGRSKGKGQNWPATWE